MPQLGVPGISLEYRIHIFVGETGRPFHLDKNSISSMLHCFIFCGISGVQPEKARDIHVKRSGT